MKKNILFLIILLGLTACKQSDVEQVTFGQICTGQNLRSPKIDPTVPYQLNSETLKERLFNANTSILLGINKVHQAKDEVNVARASLLPSLNLSTLLFAGSTATFTTSSVEMMFPFLVPGNWAKLKQSKNLFYSQIKATEAVKLNALASSLSAYVSIDSDFQLQAIYEEEVKDMNQIYTTVNNLYLAGLAAKSDLDRAEGVAALTQVGLSKIKGMLSQEEASFRKILGLELGQKIIFSSIEIEPTQFEGLSLGEVNTEALKQSPEYEQLRFLRKAAANEVFKQHFAFIGGAGVRAPGGQSSDSSIAFENSVTGSQFNIGFAQVPLIQLSQHRLQEIDLRIEELKREIAYQSEFSLNLVNEGKERYELALKADRALKSVYERDLTKYEYGLTDLQSVLLSRSQYREAKVEALRAKVQFALNRILMHRLLVSGSFLSAKNCL